MGCAGSFPGPDSPASCYLVRAEDGGRTWNVLLDLGSGSLGALQRHLSLSEIDAVVLSHLHPDHCLDLCGLYVARTYAPWAAGCPRIPVHGPAGAAERLARAHGAQGPEGMDDVYDFLDVHAEEAFTIGPFTVTPYRVNHPVVAYGLRVEAGGTVLAYTGDTDSCAALRPLCTGADLVLADSAFVEGRDRVSGIHLTGRRAAQAAVDAGGVSRLMLTHMPAWNDPEVCRAQATEVWPGTVELAEPDATYQL